MRRRPTETKRLAAEKARDLILAAATRHRRDTNPLNPTRYARRHLNQAVCVCRRNELVKPTVLKAAGFNS